MTHAIDEMVSQRLFGIIAGYEDCNDHDDLRNDPVFKLIAGRRPTGDGLASQPTLSRFENSVTPAMLQRLIDFNIATGVERLKVHHGDVPDEIILDIDPTDDATHGRQQLSLFHGFYKFMASTNSTNTCHRSSASRPRNMSSSRGCDRPGLHTNSGSSVARGRR